MTPRNADVDHGASQISLNALALPRALVGLPTFPSRSENVEQLRRLAQAKRRTDQAEATSH